MIVIMKLILLGCGDCCGGGNYATVREDLLLGGPLLYAHFSARLELGLDSASLVSSQAQGRWRQSEECLTRKSMKACMGWAELAPVLQLDHDLSFCSTVTSWKCLLVDSDNLEKTTPVTS